MAGTTKSNIRMPSKTSSEKLSPDKVEAAITQSHKNDSPDAEEKIAALSAGTSKRSGRPKGSTTATEGFSVVTVRFSDSFLERCDQAAKKNQITRSALIKLAVAQYIKEMEE